MWHRDHAVEQLMTMIGMTFEFRQNIPISRLDIKQSLLNNARFGNALDEQRVEEYCFSMKHGVSFPAPVIDKDFLILAGNQRITAARRAGRATIDAYVVTKATEMQLDDYIRRDNIRHGKGLTDDQKIQTCVELYRKHKVPVRESNDKYFGGNPKTYNLICVANRAKEVEEKLGTKGLVAAHLPTSTLAAFHPIIENANVLRDAGALALEYHFSASQVEDLVKTLKEKDTEADRIKAITNARQDLAQKTRNGSAPSPEVTLKREMIRLHRVLESGYDGKAFPPIEQLLPADKDAQKELKEIATSILNAMKHLKERTR